MQNAPSRATGEAMPIATTLTLPRSGIVLTIAMHAGKPVIIGRSGRTL